MNTKLLGWILAAAFILTGFGPCDEIIHSEGGKLPAEYIARAQSALNAVYSGDLGEGHNRMKFFVEDDGEVHVVFEDDILGLNCNSKVKALKHLIPKVKNGRLKEAKFVFEFDPGVCGSKTESNTILVTFKEKKSKIFGKVPGAKISHTIKHNHSPGFESALCGPPVYDASCFEGKVEKISGQMSWDSFLMTCNEAGF